MITCANCDVVIENGDVHICKIPDIKTELPSKVINKRQNDLIKLMLNDVNRKGEHVTELGRILMEYTCLSEAVVWYLDKIAKQTD